MKNKDKILIHAWTVYQRGDQSFLPFTHWIYLQEITKYYNQVILLSPVKDAGKKESDLLKNLDAFDNISIIPLPFSTSYASASRHFLAYLMAYKNLPAVDAIYIRYPVPFGWLAKVFHKEKKRIIHFVGDPIDATKTNPNLGKAKKILMLSLFRPEHQLYLWACKGAKVFTNGFHLAERLQRKQIKAEPVISSTLNHSDFYFKNYENIDSTKFKLIYVGYLRKAKGVETVIEAFSLLQKRYPLTELSIVGSGEFEAGLKSLAKGFGNSNIKFHGHIDDRKKLNLLLRDHHIFCFASLSEGSPRVILEAMANGLAVVSTPVGSLPAVFDEKEDILFAKFSDPYSFYEQITSLVAQPELFQKLRKQAFEKSNKYTIASFIKRIFNEE